MSKLKWEEKPHRKYEAQGEVHLYKIELDKPSDRWMLLVDFVVVIEQATDSGNLRGDKCIYFLKDGKALAQELEDGITDNLLCTNLDTKTSVTTKAVARKGESPYGGRPKGVSLTRPLYVFCQHCGNIDPLQRTTLYRCTNNCPATTASETVTGVTDALTFTREQSPHKNHQCPECMHFGDSITKNWCKACTFAPLEISSHPFTDTYKAETISVQEQETMNA